jgi:hypothetical protein
MRYRLRTLMIVLALGPPIIAYIHWKYEHRPGWHLRQIGLAVHNYSGDSLWLRLPDGRPAYMADVPPRQQPDDSTDE